MAVPGPPESITCIECSGTAHLASYLPEGEPPTPGTPLAYVCEDCGQRLDIFWEGDLD